MFHIYQWRCYLYVRLCNFVWTKVHKMYRTFTFVKAFPHGLEALSIELFSLFLSKMEILRTFVWEDTRIESSKHFRLEH